MTDTLIAALAATTLIALSFTRAYIRRPARKSVRVEAVENHPCDGRFRASDCA